MQVGGRNRGNRARSTRRRRQGEDRQRKAAHFSARPRAVLRHAVKIYPIPLQGNCRSVQGISLSAINSRPNIVADFA